MKFAERTISARTALGCLTLVSVVASTAVLLNRGAYNDFQFVSIMVANDCTQYALAVKYPAIRDSVFANMGDKDMASLSARIARDRRVLAEARERMNRRLLLDCITLAGSLAVFAVAGFNLLRAGSRHRPSAQAFGV
jgi:hypothetical protein